MAVLVIIGKVEWPRLNVVMILKRQSCSAHNTWDFSVFLSNGNVVNSADTVLLYFILFEIACGVRTTKLKLSSFRPMKLWRKYGIKFVTNIDSTLFTQEKKVFECWTNIFS